MRMLGASSSDLGNAAMSNVMLLSVLCPSGLTPGKPSSPLTILAS